MLWVPGLLVPLCSLVRECGHTAVGGMGPGENLKLSRMDLKLVWITPASTWKMEQRKDRVEIEGHRKAFPPSSDSIGAGEWEPG